MNRVCSLLKAMYAWDLLNELSRFRAPRLESGEPALLTNVMNARSMKPSGNIGRLRKGRNGQRLAGGKGDGLTTLEGLGENWRLLMDALSLRPVTKKFFSYTQVNFRRDVGFEGPSTAAATATTTAVTVNEQVRAGELEGSAPRGKWIKKGKKGKKRGGGGGVADFKMCAAVLNHLVFADDQKQEFPVPVPPRFVEVLKASIDGKVLELLEHQPLIFPQDFECFWKAMWKIRCTLMSSVF